MRRLLGDSEGWPSTTLHFSKGELDTTAVFIGTTASNTRDLEVDKPGKLLIMAHEAGTRRIVARDCVEIKAGEPVPFWKLTTFVDVDDLVDPPGQDEGHGGPLFDLLWGAGSVPNSALIVISENSLSMRVKRTGVWSACCPPPFGGDDRVWVWPECGLFDR